MCRHFLYASMNCKGWANNRPLIPLIYCKPYREGLGHLEPEFFLYYCNFCYHLPSSNSLFLTIQLMLRWPADSTKKKNCFSLFYFFGNSVFFYFTTFQVYVFSLSSCILSTKTMQRHSRWNMSNQMLSGEKKSILMLSQHNAIVISCDQQY